jgi:hypothetical protein
MSQGCAPARVGGKSPLRLWHVMLAVAVVCVTMALVRLDSSCAPMTPILAGSYVCGYVGMIWPGRRIWPSCAGFLFGLNLVCFVWFKV